MMTTLCPLLKVKFFFHHSNMGSAYFTFLPAPLCVFIMSVFDGHCHKEGRC